MASVTIRNLEEQLKQRLRLRAAAHGRSMEEELREILRIALADAEPPAEDLAAAIRARFAPMGGVELELPRREMGREPPDFE